MKDLISRGAVVLVFSMLGCHQSVTSHKLHVTGATVCEDLDGSFEGVEYRLSVVRPTDKLGVACYSPISTADVGKDFDARREMGRVVVVVPDRGEVDYEIDSARELKDK